MVQKKVMSGLRYKQTTFRKGIEVDKNNYMVGSYGPKAQAHSFLTPFDDAPNGKIARGIYHVTSLFTDDDKNEHLKVQQYNTYLF